MSKYILNKLNREITKYTTTNNYFQDIQIPWQGILDVIFNNGMALDDLIHSDSITAK